MLKRTVLCVLSTALLMLSLDGEATTGSLLSLSNGESPGEQRNRTRTDSSQHSLTFGGTRSRDNSVGSVTDVPEDLDTFLLHNSPQDKLELTAILTRLQSSCQSIAINIVHVQEELQTSIQTTTQLTSSSLDQHTSNLSDYASIVAAAVRASLSLPSQHVAIKTKMNELERLSSKIQQLKIFATTLEQHILTLTEAEGSSKSAKS